MRRTVAYTLFSALSALVLLAEQGYAANPRDQLLSHCVHLHQKIERYTRLRRSGGSTARMEAWRQSRHAHQNTFREKRCHKRYADIRRVIKERARSE